MDAYATYQPMPTPQPTAETLVFLRPEQLRSARMGENRTAKSRLEAKNGRNALIRLAESIKRYGVLEPLAVRLATDAAGFPYYELLEGERRFRAACIAGITKIPCKVLRADDKQCAEWAILERLERGEHNMFEMAESFSLLMRDFQLTQEEIARKLGLSQSAVANKLRLLRLTQEERAYILQNGLTERHARALLRLTEEGQRRAVLQEVARHKLNVAQTEAKIDAFLTPERSSPPVFHILESNGVQPRKFAMRDLRPLYNSIDRTLSIFRKTGASVDCTHEESESGVRIVISIPK